MKTEYLVLWIDDRLTAVETDQDDIKDFLEDYGIKVEYINFNRADGEDHDKIIATLKKDELDLIFVDYHMPNLNGDILIDHIRAAENFLPIIFYSAGGAEALKDARFEGVYYSGRNQLQIRAQSIIKSLLKKEHTSKSTRGLLMEGVSEIEAHLNSLILSGWDKLNAKQKNDVLAYLVGILTDRQKSAQKNLLEAPQNEKDFIDVISLEQPRYDAMTRWRILQKILDDLGIEEIRRKNFSELQNPVDKALFWIRNQYAHKTRKQLEATQHNLENCVYIRKELRRQLENIDNILTTLSS